MNDFSKYNSGVQSVPTYANNSLRSQNVEDNQFKDRDRFFYDGVAPKIETLTSIGKFEAGKINSSLWGLGSVNTNQNASQQRLKNKMLDNKDISGGSFGSFEKKLLGLGGGSFLNEIFPKGF